MENEITVIEAYELISTNRDLQIVDLREPTEFAQASIDRSVNIPFAQLSAELGEFDGRKKTLLIDKDGSKSHQAKALLDACGYTSLVVRGGYDDWASIIG